MNISKHILESALAALRVNKHWNRITEDTKRFGRLVVHIGNALASGATLEGGFAGLIVHIFSDGAMIPALQLPKTLQHLQELLCPGGKQQATQPCTENFFAVVKIRVFIMTCHVAPSVV
jgi:hypothetical protein